MHARQLLFLSLFTLTLSSTLVASELGDRLNRELKGAWGVVETELYSSCSGSYNDNTVSAGGVASKAPNRFNAGEIVKIDNVKVKRQRVDLLLTLNTGIRTRRTDGPFELYDDRVCKVQMIFPVPRDQVKSGDMEAILAQIKQRITLFSSLEAAWESDDWNGRELEELPDDYEHTLELYAAWKAEQTNASVQAGISKALAKATDIAEDLDDDADYLAGFAAGAEKMSSFYPTDCSSLLTASFSGYDHNAPKDESRSWRDGWDDGQELIFNILLAGRLDECRVPVPIVTGP